MEGGMDFKVLLLTHLIYHWRAGPWSCPQDSVSQGLEPSSLDSLVQPSSHHLQPLCLQLLPPVLTPFGNIAFYLAGCLLRGGQQIGWMTFLQSALTLPCLVNW